MTPVNPFASYSVDTVGDDFFGRERQLALIRSRWLDGRDPGNLPLVGMPRVGKSSLVYQAAEVHAAEFARRRMVFVGLNLGDHSSAGEFFCGLATQVFARIQDVNWDTRELRDHLERVAASASAAGSQGELKTRVYAFFTWVRRANIRPVVFVDQFDSVQRLFPSESEFQILRELGQRHTLRVALVTASRRPIEVLEKKGHSTLASAMGQVLYLKPFSDAEADGFYQRCEAAGLPLAPPARHAVRHATGHQPYLLGMLGNNLVHTHLGGAGVSVQEVCADTAREFVVHYREAARMLRDAGLYTPLMEILFGPVHTATPDHITQLEQYGLLAPPAAADAPYRAFSEHYHEYLRAQSRTVDYWPLWRQTEVAVRELIDAFLSERYGGGWQTTLPAKAPDSLRKRVGEWQRLRDDERRQFSDRASEHLLDYSFTGELFELMCLDWQWFERVLGRKKTHWEADFGDLNRIRKPLAHGRNVNALGKELRRAEVACQLLIDKIAAWQSAAPTD